MLTAAAVRNAKARERDYKLSDGRGLVLLVRANGAKWWRLRYTFQGAEKMLSLGVYPDVSLALARAHRDAARRLLAQGIDPSAARKRLRNVGSRPIRSRKVIVTPEFAHYPKTWHFSPGLDTGEFVFFSGITGTRADLTIATDAELQFREAFRILKANIVQAGLDICDVVEITTYHVDLKRHLSAFMKVKDEFICEPYSAWTAIGVSELISEGALVEIRAIARRG
jgi:enamine deaminase RidA (YjgF/YER057c/UK114 family)